MLKNREVSLLTCCFNKNYLAYYQRYTYLFCIDTDTPFLDMFVFIYLLSNAVA